MQFKDILSVMAGIIFVVGFAPYIRAILRDRNKLDGTKPMKVSWLIWTSIDIITFAGMYAKGAVNGSICGAIAGALVVVILAFKYGKPGWTLLDKLCICGAILGIVLWQASGNPNLGIMVSLSILLLGSIPTVRSAWHDPLSENRSGWTIWLVGAICGVIAIPQMTIADAAQPFAFLVIETIMVSILYLRKRPSSNPTQKVT